jgi:hypothetical protein
MKWLLVLGAVVFSFALPTTRVQAGGADGNQDFTVGSVDERSGGTADCRPAAFAPLFAAPAITGGTQSLIAMGLIVVFLGVVVAYVWQSETFSIGTVPSSQPGAEPANDTAASKVDERVPSVVDDDDVVLNLLEDHEGRMKQAAIVEETNWSKSKVSMLLSEMENRGDISKLRVGRENIICLRGSEPEAAGSPFEED